MKQFRLWLALASLFAVVATRADASTLTEYFTSNPLQDGWQVFGNTNLFQWDSTNQVLDVTWDSSQTNSYLYHPLGTTLTRSNDFTIAFDIQLNQTTVGGFGSELAVGLLNQAEATNSTFNRSTGANSPDLVEFDYFPDAGFGATTWPLFVDSNSVFNYNGSSDYAIFAPNLGDWYHVVMTYTATNQTMVTTMTNFTQTSGVTIVDPLDGGFADFNVDTISISSYQDDGFGDSILAQGAIGNLVVTIPAATPVATAADEDFNFTGNPLQNGWQVFGDTNLFQWDSTNEVLDVTWDSSQTNSYFYHPLGATLTRSNNFSIAFDMQLTQASASGFGFQTAVGLFNQAEATNSAFNRSTGANSPDLVEFDYFPDAGFGATTWPLFVDSNSDFNFNSSSDYAIYAPTTGDWYHVVMTYTATNQTMVTTLTNFAQTSGVTIVDPLASYMTDFKVDTLSISSYQDDGFGDSIFAQGAIGNFVVALDPHIVTGPAPAAVVVGQNANFTVTATGLSALTYRWLQNGTNVIKEPGATTASLTITNTKTAFSNYLYRVVVSDGNGSVTSAPAKLFVVSKAVTVGTVASKAVFAGQPVIFSTTVSGGLAPTYQWYSNNVTIAGATFINYTNALVNFSDAGSYYLAVSDATLGSPVNSAHATLTVNVPEQISNPMATTVKQGQLFTLRTMVSNNTKLPYANTFQWYSNSVAINGATFATYTNSVDSTNGNIGPTVVDYTVVVGYSYGPVSSNLTSAIGAVTVVSDTNAPMLSINTPANNATLTNNIQVINSAYTVTGTATDNAHVTQVFVSLNGSAYQPASVMNNPSVASVKWSLPVNPVVGTNSLSAYSVDFAGNFSHTNTRAFFFAVPASVSITVVGTGMVGATNVPFFVNRSYTFTETAAHNNLFSNWVDNTDSTIGTSNKFTFTAETNFDLTVNFATNRFLAQAGTYYGLFSDTNNGETESNAGWFTATVTPSDGKQSFSASLFVDGDSLGGISGTFDLTGLGTASKTIARKGKAPLTLSLQLNFDDTIGGTVTDSLDNWASTISGDLATYSMAKPSPYAGTYNLLIPGFSDATVGPAGYGYATLKIATNGMVTASGSLADGQTLSLQTAAVSTNGDVPLYSKAYVYEFNNGTTNFASYEGALVGWLNFTSSPPSGNLYWLKNAWTNGYYNGGFSNETAVAGSAYNSAPVTPVGGFLITNGLVTFSGGNLTGNITDNVSVSNAVVKIIGAPDQLKSLMFMPFSGAVSGTFTNTGTHTLTTFKGLYVPGTNDIGTNVIGGWFLGTSQGGSLLVQPQ